MATTSIELKRHYRELSTKETDELVDAVADLIVTFLKGRRDTDVSAEKEQGQTSEQNNERENEHI